jgi:hypothetical protein
MGAWAFEYEVRGSKYEGKCFSEVACFFDRINRIYRIVEFEAWEMCSHCEPVGS